MEDIFLILIGLLWLAYTFYTRNQKKQKGRVRPTDEVEAEKEHTILEKILMGQEVRFPEPEYDEDEFEFETEEAESQPSYNMPSGKNKSADPNPFLNYELDQLNKRKMPSMIEFAHYNTPIEIEDLDDFEVPGFLDEDFDLRNAIIYQAVLETPYIDYK